MTNFSDLRQALAALFAALVVASTAALADDVQEASKLLRSGQHQQALERVNKVLASRPKDAQARFLKGLIFAEQGNTKDATDILLALTKDFPDLPEPYNNLAVIYASQGQYDKARGALEQSIRTHPSYATAYENLGDVYAKLASQAYDKALQIDSANPGAKNKLALVRDLVGGAAPAKPVAIAVAAVAPKEPAKARPPLWLLRPSPPSQPRRMQAMRTYSTRSTPGPRHGRPRTSMATSLSTARSSRPQPANRAPTGRKRAASALARQRASP